MGHAVRLRETIKDLRSQLEDLEATNRELSRNEGKYRARSQDLRERLNEASVTIDRLKAQLAMERKKHTENLQAVDASRKAEQLEKDEMTKQLESIMGGRDALQAQVAELRRRLRDRERIVKEFSQQLTTSIPLIQAEMQILKTTMLADHADAMAKQQKSYERRIQEYREREMRREALEQGIMLGRKKQFDSERKQELEAMQRLRQEEEEVLGSVSDELPNFASIATPMSGPAESPHEILRRAVSKLPAACFNGSGVSPSLVAGDAASRLNSALASLRNLKT